MSSTQEAKGLIKAISPIDKMAKIYVAGHKGMVGSAVCRKLKKKGYQNIISRTSSELNLRDQQKVKDFFLIEKPEYVFLLAAKVGGIQANIDSPVNFLLENLQIQNNIISSAHSTGVKKLVFVGSSCIYPKNSIQPIQESSLLTNVLEPTNEGYAIAKIAGLKLCEYYNRQYGFKSLSLMPCNLYGKNDSFDPIHSHVLSALVRKFVESKDEGVDEVSVWGSGIARREFMNVDDFAKIAVDIFEEYDFIKLLNIGTGKDISIKELAIKIKNAVGYNGIITWDTSRPDGMLLKRMDVTVMKNMGYESTISLDEGIEEMIEIYNTLKGNKDGRYTQ